MTENAWACQQQREQLEYAVLRELLTCYPGRLTATDLIARVLDKQGTTEDKIRQALRELTRADLADQQGDLVEPTYTARKAFELFRWA